MGIGFAVPSAFYHGELPSLTGRPILEAALLFSLILVSCLAMEWTWRTVWGLIETPARLKDPATSLRWTILFMLLAVLCRILPDTVQAMVWAESSPGSRYFLATVDRTFDVISTVPFFLAWTLTYLGGPMVIYQLRREPLPLHLWPTWRQVSRPGKIALACLALALALTYLR